MSVDTAATNPPGSLPTTPPNTPPRMDPKLRPLMVFAWIWVATPFSYGIYKLLQKIDALFT
ncbi:MAG: MFS transporter small subunit [Sporichthyaceae bacterium]